MKIKQVDGLQATLDGKCGIDPNDLLDVNEGNIPVFLADTSPDLVASSVNIADVSWAITEVTKARKEVLGIVSKIESFSLALSDAGKYIRWNNANEGSCTVPANSQVPFPIGTTITIRQIGAGIIQMTYDQGVTLNGDTKTAGQHKSLQIIKVDTDVWDIIGGVE